MTLATHGDRKYQNSALDAAAEWDALRVEHRHIGSGAHSPVTPDCTELVVILSGRAMVTRTGDGQRQEALAQGGTSWLVPAGTQESLLELDGAMEALHLFLPPALVENSALADYDLDPDKVRLAYAGGFADPLLLQIGNAFRTMLDRGAQPTDRLFADGMQSALAAHLLATYTIDRWQPPARAPSLDPKRLQRVLDFVESRIASDIRLDDLAAEACLSPFHFTRLFSEATGLSPHRYVTERRVQAARDKLALNHSSLVEIALDTGFGSQANFIRVFRKVTGLTPGQYRNIHAR